MAGISTAWKSYCRNKRSFCLDFRSESAAKILPELAAGAGILVESFRPGTLEKMHLAPETLLSRNPSLVIVRISGWGQDGPYRDRPGFGTLVEGISGFASMNGFADREPVLPPIYLGDMTAGLYGAMGALAALRQVEVNNGKGQVIDLPLLDPLMAILGPQVANYRLTGKVRKRTGSRSTNSAPRNVYRTRDERWVCLSDRISTRAETSSLHRGRSPAGDGAAVGTHRSFLPLGITGRQEEAIHHVRLQLRLAAGEAALPCFDRALADYADADGFGSGCRCCAEPWLFRQELYSPQPGCRGESYLFTDQGGDHRSAQDCPRSA